MYWKVIKSIRKFCIIYWKVIKYIRKFCDGYSIRLLKCFIYYHEGNRTQKHQKLFSGDIFRLYFIFFYKKIMQLKFFEILDNLVSQHYITNFFSNNKSTFRKAKDFDFPNSVQKVKLRSSDEFGRWYGKGDCPGLSKHPRTRCSLMVKECKSIPPPSLLAELYNFLQSLGDHYRRKMFNLSVARRNPAVLIILLTLIGSVLNNVKGISRKI